MYDIESQNHKFVAAFCYIAEAAKERTLAAKDIQDFNLIDNLIDKRFVFKLGFPEKTTYVKDFIEKYPESFVLLSFANITVGELQTIVKENLNKKTFIIEDVSVDDQFAFLYILKHIVKKENKPGENLKCSSIIIIE